MPTSPPPLRYLAAMAAVLLLSGCTGGESDPAGAAPDADLTGCTPDTLETVEQGRLTLSTGAVTRAPWVVGGDAAAKTSANPNDGKGYDAAVGFALAGRLGFAKPDVTWMGIPFAEAIKPGEKSFDVNVNQATITPERQADVDFSTPYYVMRQAVVSLAGRPASDAASLADLRNVTVAVVEGSAAQRVLTEQVELDTPPAAYPDLDKVRGAVSSGTQQALAIDFQTAMQLDRNETQLVDGELVGQLPRGDEATPAFGLVLEKGSPLTRCVNAALAALRNDGTLDRLERQWLMDEPGFPELS